MQFLGLEQVSGILQVRFGRDIPEAKLYFDSGQLAAAEFGDVLGDSVLDMLICQEFLIKEIRFDPGRAKAQNQYAAVVKRFNISQALLTVSKDVDKCQARSLIYGLLPIEDQRANVSQSLLGVLHDFSKWEPELKGLPSSRHGKHIPLRQCALLDRAFRSGQIAYQTPLISLKELQPLLKIVDPLSTKERTNLRGYMKSLLPHSKATHMPLERFYAFAAAVESIANRRSAETGEKIRVAIRELIDKAKASTKFPF